MDDLMDQVQEVASNDSDRLINGAAVAIALIATLLALCGVKADNMDYGILQEQNQALDMWNMYQAKSMKQYMYKLQNDALESTALAAVGLSPANRATLTAKLTRYEEEIARYEDEKRQTKAKAEGHEGKAGAMNLTANQLDYTEVFLSLAISLLAIAILTRKRWLFGVALVPAVLGAAAGLMALIEVPWDVPLPGFLS
jgi:hypothetical protein